MKILLIGNIGQVGWELERTLMTLGKVVAVDYPRIDLAQPDSILQWVRETQPQVIVNAAAYTDVDKAESEPDLVFAINATAPEVLAEEAKELGAVFLHYSTDYVFDGKKQEPYTEGDTPNPLNVYGKSKLAGEQAVQAVGGAYLILRTSWVYSTRRECFLTQVLHWARTQKVMRVVTDQVASPTWCRVLAEATAQILAKGRDELPGWIQERSGVYHLAGSGSASRYEWAQAILECDPHKETHIVEQLLLAKTAEFPAPAQRPQYSALDCTRAMAVFGLFLPAWETSLRLALHDFVF
ncbi:dTDP-4-dehydrorhamnose reductase [Candidatus Parcubacteria bacterium]|nr:MAG: dTDP-4-dehydrorhamnose reductase [Candidatus Parcubacteria bacterium]